MDGLVPTSLNGILLVCTQCLTSFLEYFVSALRIRCHDSRLRWKVLQKFCTDPGACRSMDRAARRSPPTPP
eukprot:2874855-Prymnesium_polylepis.1